LLPGEFPFFKPKGAGIMVTFVSDIVPLSLTLVLLKTQNRAAAYFGALELVDGAYILGFLEAKMKEFC
jgi:hypothetical protein